MILRIWDVTLTVRDLKKSVRFYGKVLGLRKKYEYPDYAGFDCGGVEIGLGTAARTGRHGKGEPVIDFLVDDIDADYRRLRKRRVRFIRPPRDQLWGGRTALFRDPDGNILQMVQIDWRRYLPVCAEGA